MLIETLGDRTQADNVPLHSIGGQGVFVKEVQRAVLDGRAEVAVHSAKDLPVRRCTDGLEIGAFLERRSVADVLIGSTLERLAHGAPGGDRVGAAACATAAVCVPISSSGSCAATSRPASSGSPTAARS